MDEETKLCTKCLVVKPISSFSKNKAKKNGIERWCRICLGKVRRKFLTDNPDKVVEYRKRATDYKRDWHRNNREHVKRLRMARQYGMTEERLASTLAEQNNSCAICKNPFDSNNGIHVDHDHSCCMGEMTCGKCVRGLLCRECNHMLENARDKPELLNEGARYLSTYQSRSK